MSDLLDLLDDWTDAPEWVPLYKPHRVTLATVIVPDRCRDCGTRVTWMNGGGAGELGVYQVCEACMSLDSCTTRESIRGPEWHCSNWGEVHRADEHDELVAAQERRRARYRARVRRTEVAS